MTPEPTPPESEGGHTGADPHRPERLRAAPIMCGPRQPTPADLEAIEEFGEWLTSKGSKDPGREGPR